VLIVSLEYVQELAAVVMAFSNGEIHFYEMESKQAKDAGVLDGSIMAAKWSPNEEYYAVASTNGSLYLFTPEFDILYEAPIDDDDLTFKANVPQDQRDYSVS
jgi:elongator complex protein 1